MIYDCFTFFKELDLLELRLNMLYDHVDRFVLVEANKTHVGSSKPLIFEENKDRFARFMDKIIHRKVHYDEVPDNWHVEITQRNRIIDGLDQCKPDDIIIISDVDEIPNPALLKNLTPPGKCIGLQQLMCYYYFNNINISKPLWTGSAVTTYRYLQKVDASDIRLLVRKKRVPKLRNGGWHFSYLGNTEYIVDKIRSAAHQEYNTDAITSVENISKALDTGQDLFGRDYKYAAVPLDESFPELVLNNREKYAQFIKETAPEAETISSIVNRIPEHHRSAYQKFLHLVRD